MKDDLIVVAGTAIVVAGVWCCAKIKEMSGKLNKGIEGAMHMAPSDISQAIVERAVAEAVDRKVSAIADSVSKDIRSTMTSRVNTEVHSAVESAYSQLHGAVTDRIASEAEKIDMLRLKAEVCDKASKQVAKKLDDILDDQVAEFNKQMKNTQRIYQSIADTMRPSNDNELRIKLN